MRSHTWVQELRNYHGSKILFLDEPGPAAKDGDVGTEIKSRTVGKSVFILHSKSLYCLRCL